jgi:hypothetical protein
MKKTKNKRFRTSERNILMYLLERHIESGEYFDKKNQHYKMCQELLKKLASLELYK